MPKLIITCTPLAIAKIRAHCAANKTTPLKELLKHIENDINDADLIPCFEDKLNLEIIEARKRYNQAFIKTLKKFGYALTEEAKNNYLF